ADLADRDARLTASAEERDQERVAHAAVVAQLRQDTDAALGDAERALDEAVRQAQAQREQASAEQATVEALRESSRLARLDVATSVQALAQAVTPLAGATSLSEVLDALAQGLAAQAPRTAVLVFQGDRARLWRGAGFGEDQPALDGEFSLAAHADLQAILDAATPAFVASNDEAPLVLGLAPLPPCARGLAVPVAIGGQSAALVYADAGEHGDTAGLAPGWSEAVEVLGRHAARCLETLTAMRAAGYARTQRPAVVVPMPPHLTVVQRPTLDTPVGDALDQARRVARLLVSEIRLNREAEIVEGRAQGDLVARVGQEIERARSQYHARVPDAVPGRDALFDEEVLRTLANGDASLLRRPTGS
ncbi:MAG: hypothetical protein ACR2LU_10280, partial [Luteitalea sp.]